MSSQLAETWLQGNGPTDLSIVEPPGPTPALVGNRSPVDREPTAPSLAPDEPSLEAVGNEIAELAAHIHAATCRMLQLLHRFDLEHGWTGWATCAQWLSWRTGMSLEAAREKVRVAHAMHGLPRITRAFESGQISYSKVRAMTRIATPEIEESLMNIALHGTAAHVEKVVRGYRRADPERETVQANRRQEGRFLSTRQDEESNLVIRGKLPPELGARVAKALDAAMDALAEGMQRGEGEAAAPPVLDERPTYGQRRADALVLLADSSLQAGLPGRRAADTHQVVVHVDAEVLADPGADGQSRLEDGPQVSAETSRRLACDAGAIALLEDADGNPLSVGRRRRTVPPSLRRALRHRDPGCRFPGCHHTRFLEAHHVRHWADGGETSLGNLVHLCSFHHRQLHEGGYRIRRGAGGEPEFVTKYGVALGDAPRQPAGSSEGLRAMRDDVGADRVARWGGDRIDYADAVTGLLDAAGSMGPWAPGYAIGPRVSAETSPT